MIAVEVAYATRNEQKILPLVVEETATLLQAIEQSGILKLFPQIDLKKAQVGVWGQIKPLNTQVNAGDRIEIYRPLLMDPKQSRLLRAELFPVVSLSMGAGAVTRRKRKLAAKNSGG